MKIIDLSPQYEQIYFCCLEDWSYEIKEAGNHKENWYNNHKDKGIRVKLAMNDEGDIGGMIQYIPIENTFVNGKDLYVILCIWVHGLKKGRGNFQKRGMGKALLEAAESDVRELGAKGIVSWGISLPFFMKAAWFKKRGYEVVDKEGIIRLLWKPFSVNAAKPSLIKQNKLPDLVQNKVNISLFKNGWCPAFNMVYERTLKAVIGNEDKVVINEFDASDINVLNEWGISDALFIDNKKVRTGPPLSFKKIQRKINKQIRKLPSIT
ncbi:MAG: GNAT family N-acetyltransferase [Ignavibacteriae bacterium]|nr:GNAT family N-acetyltransferase [Ignavibacteriota bacterium]